MGDMIDRDAVQSELRAYLVHESSEIALNVEQIIAALPAAPAWKSNPEFLASLREVPEGAFKDVRAGALKSILDERSKVFDAMVEAAEYAAGQDVSFNVVIGRAIEAAILALIPEAKPAEDVRAVALAVADALDAWADAQRQGRQIDASITGLRDMAKVVRALIPEART